MAAAFFAKLRQKGFGAIDHAPEVNVHHPFEIIVSQFLNRGDLRDTRIVDDNIRAAQLTVDLLRKGINRLA